MYSKQQPDSDSRNPQNRGKQAMRPVLQALQRGQETEAARLLLQAVAEEPVPERLRSLALALEESLKRRTDPSPPGATDLHETE